MAMEVAEPAVRVHSRAARTLGAPRGLLHGIRHPGRFLWRGLLQPLLGWLLLGWLTLFIPRKRGRIVVIGVSRQFADNSKYFFLHLATSRPPGVETRYLSDDPVLTEALRQSGLPVLPAPSLQALWYLLRCETVVADASSWVRPMRYQLLWRARKVQLWHGCPLKRIERDDQQRWPARGLMALSQRLIGRYPRYDVLLSPSPLFTDLAFRTAFDSRDVIESDYPRNVVFRRRDPLFLLGTDAGAMAWMQAGRRRGLRTVCFLPTLRDTGGDAVSDGRLDLDRLEQFAHTHGLQILIKRHPVAAGPFELHAGTNVRTYDARADIYPLLPDCDVLVTDYSSVLFDFLHTNRPIVFFAWDLDKYQQRDRSLYFEYERVVPGPICRTPEELESAILTCGDMAQPDPFAGQRAAMLAWAFVGTDAEPSILLAKRRRAASDHPR